jgi:hypothetical protein
MKVLTVVLSYNTPARTLRCYNELCILKPDWHKVLILDNSKEKLVPRTPNTIWLGEENRGHGGMLDYVFKDILRGTDAGFDLVGIINNDTYDYAPRFIEKLTKWAIGEIGIISPAIKPGGSCWPSMMRTPSHNAHMTNFVETIAPWYGPKLIMALQKLCPMEYFGYIDRAASITAKRLGLNNIIVDELEITHEAGIGRKELGTYADFCARSKDSIAAWYATHPEIADLVEVWPDEINSTDWERKQGPDEGSIGTAAAVRP